MHERRRASRENSPAYIFRGRYIFLPSVSIEGKRKFWKTRPCGCSDRPMTKRSRRCPRFQSRRADGSPTGTVASIVDRTRRRRKQHGSTWRSRGSPRLRPGFARVAKKKLDPVTVSSASGTVSIRFPTLHRCLVFFSDWFWTRVRHAISNRPINHLSIRVEELF